MTPAIALGQAVHAVLDTISELSAERRFDTPLPVLFEESWKNVAGSFGGFTSDEEENKAKSRGRDMLGKLAKNPGPLKNQAVKIRMPKNSLPLPHFTLSAQDGIVLCGKVDWLEYIPETKSVHIIDFKTGRKKEDGNSLQLPIYQLLVQNTQKWPVEKVSYWYLENDNNGLEEQPMDGLDAAIKRLLEVAQKMKLARRLEKFACPTDGCSACRPFEAIIQGEAELVHDDGRTDVYMLKSIDERSLDEQSELL